MDFSYFRLKSADGKIFSLNNLKELKKSDLGDDAALIRLFNLFDYQNKDGTEGSDGVLNKEELKSLFDFMSYGAKIKGNASIFEQAEAEEFVSKSTVNGKTFKELGIKAADLFNFLSALISSEEENSINVSGTEAIKKSYTPEEIEEISVQTISGDVKKARQIFDSQKENQGAVSDFVNGTKEAFDTEYAASRVNRYIMREELCADLLEKSRSETGLSEKEYLEAKIDLAARMLPELKSTSLRNIIIQNISQFGVIYRVFNGKSRAEQELIVQEIELQLLKEALRRLTPEELTSFIQNLVSASDEEYANEAEKFAEQMIKSSLDYKLLNNQDQKAPLESRGGISYKYQAAPGSIESIEQQSAKYRKMTFEETFEAERGVPYNADLVMDYAQKDAQMQFILGVHNKRQQIYDILHDPTVALDSKIQFGGTGSGTNILENNLHGAIITVLRELYGNDIEKMQEGLDKLGIKGLKIVNGANGLNSYKLAYDNENIDNSNPLANRTELNEYDLVNVAKELQGMVDTNYQNALAGKTLEEYSDEVKSAYIMAYGDRNSGDIADAFVQSQQEGVQTVKTLTQTGAMLVMVAGQVIPVGGQAAAVMIYGGLIASAVGGTAISAIENYTKAGGFTEEDKKEMLKELATSIALVASGVRIGKTSEAAFRALVIRNCPKLLAFASEIGIDATMGIVADFAITGQIDLSGEGIAQLQAILVGILHAKGNFRTYIDTHAGDITTKSNSTESKPKTDDATLKKDNAQGIESEPTQKASGSDADGTEVPRPKFGLEEDVARQTESSGKLRKTNDNPDPEPIPKDEITGDETKVGKTTRMNKDLADVQSKEELINILKDKVDSEYIDILKNLSEEDFAILKRAYIKFDNMKDTYDIRRITDLLTLLKEHSKLTNRSISEELDFINKILAEPTTFDKNLLIDSKATYRIPTNTRELEIIETLMKLRETCDNPLLNIDNICILATRFENISDVNILTNRIKAKNSDGTYKYGKDDFEINDIEPELEIKNRHKRQISYWEGYPEVQQKLRELYKDADKEMTDLIDNKLAKFMPGGCDSKSVLSELNKLNVNYLKSEINSLLEGTDQTFKNMINDEITRIEYENSSKMQKIQELQKLQDFIDYYYSLKGKRINNGADAKSVYWKEYLDYLAKEDPEMAARLKGEEKVKNAAQEPVKIPPEQKKRLYRLKQLLIEYGNELLYAFGIKKRPDLEIDFKKIDEEIEMERLQKYYEYLQRELSEAQKVELFIQYCKYNKNEMCDYLYNEIYLGSRNFSPEVKQKAAEISEKYGVKVFFEADITDNECIDLVKGIEDELSIWDTKSNGKAKMPPTLDFTKAKRDYIDPKRAYGEGTVVGFSECSTNGSISIYGKLQFQGSIRHEMTHTNDLKQLSKFPDDSFVVKENDEIVAKKCKYYDEFVKIGIPEWHIAYAYNNPMEFIAVASKGDLTKCSPAFRQVLIDFGMPEWRFDF